jgi:hypothetical protein
VTSPDQLGGLGVPMQQQDRLAIIGPCFPHRDRQWTESLALDRDCMPFKRFERCRLRHGTRPGGKGL